MPPRKKRAAAGAGKHAFHGLSEDPPGEGMDTFPELDGEMAAVLGELGLSLPLTLPQAYAALCICFDTSRHMKDPHHAKKEPPASTSHDSDDMSEDWSDWSEDSQLPRGYSWAPFWAFVAVVGTINPTGGSSGVFANRASGRDDESGCRFESANDRVGDSLARRCAVFIAKGLFEESRGAFRSAFSTLSWGRGVARAESVEPRASKKRRAPSAPVYAHNGAGRDILAELEEWVVERIPQLRCYTTVVPQMVGQELLRFLLCDDLISGAFPFSER